MRSERSVQNKVQKKKENEDRVNKARQEAVEKAYKSATRSKLSRARQAEMAAELIAKQDAMKVLASKQNETDAMLKVAAILLARRTEELENEQSAMIQKMQQIQSVVIKQQRILASKTRKASLTTTAAAAIDKRKLDLSSRNSSPRAAMANLSTEDISIDIDRLVAEVVAAPVMAPVVNITASQRQADFARQKTSSLSRLFGYDGNSPLEILRDASVSKATANR